MPSMNWPAVAWIVLARSTLSPRRKRQPSRSSPPNDRMAATSPPAAAPAASPAADATARVAGATAIDAISSADAMYVTESTQNASGSWLRSRVTNRPAIT